MEREVREIIYLSMELLLTAILITFVFVLYSPARDLVAQKKVSESLSTHIDEYRKFYLYDDKYVTGDDIISLIQTNKEGYSYYVDISVGNKALYMCIDSSYVEETSNLVDDKGNALSSWDSDLLKQYCFINKQVPELYNNTVSTIDNEIDKVHTNKRVIYKAHLVRVPRETIIDSSNRDDAITIRTIHNVNAIQTSNNDFNLNSFYDIINSDVENEIYGVVFDRYDEGYCSQEVINSLTNQ